VLLKGNIDVAGLDNTAGSLALQGNVPEEDAFLVARLRQAGAVILGTANLSEWANFRSSRSSSGWSSIGRQTKNPYVLDRNPCGSSSGSAVAVAAGLAVAAIGTETDGSVVCPAGQNGVVGIKPTIGLVSRGGIIPIAHSQDTAGPMARTVRDAALMLQAIAAKDPEDPAAAEAPAEAPDYTAALSEDPRLDGVRLGVWRDHFGAGDDPDVDACLEAAIAAFEDLGAEVVDADLGEREGLGDAESAVLSAEFKHDIAAYLDAHGAPNGLSTLEQIMAFNDQHAETVMPYFGQERFQRALDGGEPDSPEYLEALAASKRISRGAIDGALAKDGLAAVIAPTNGPAWPIDLVNGDHFVLSSSQLAAVSGYPNVTVPMCFVHQLPIGLSIFGGAWSEAELIRIAHAFEQQTHARRPPRFLPTLELP
jgi:amidase